VTLFALTDLETHLIERHGVSLDMIRATRRRFDKPAELIARQSHALMHAMGDTDHDHLDDGPAAG